jgi:hypothetical protein
VLVEVFAMFHKFWHLASAVSLAFLALAARADELPKGVTGAPDATNDEIARLIEQLDEPAFTDRQEASRKLSELGEVALPQLEKAAAKGSREATGRAMDLLKRQFHEGSDTGRQAAREALDRLSQSKFASTSQRARNVLRPPRDPATLPLFGGMMPNGLIPRGNIVTRTVVTHESNGRRLVEVKENDASVKIQTLPSGRIEVEINERQNGRDVKRSITARDLDELKQKDAEAAKIYEQYQPARMQGIAGLPDAIRLPPGRAGR